MNDRDYANRKPTKKSKPRSRNKSSNPPKSKLFFAVMILLTTSLLGGFGYFLWSINNSADTVISTAVVEATTPKSKSIAPKKDPNALPPKPKEVWSYERELVNKKVEVDVPKPTKPSRPYQMQCASFRTQAQAEELKAMIAFQGLSAHIRKVRGTTGDWYKVSLGPYDRKREAEKQRHVMQRAGINGCIILYWEG